MTKEIITEQLTDIYRDVFDDETIVLKEDMTTNDIDGWDSLTHLRLIMQIEKTFDIKFTTAQIKETVNVGKLIDIVSELIIL